MREGWEYKKLGEVFTNIKNGANIKQRKGASGIPITRIETLSKGVFNFDRLGYADLVDSKKYENYILNEGDILMSHINSLEFVGRAVVCHKINREIIHGMNLLRLIPSALAFSDFYAYYFKCSLFKKNIANITHKSVNQASFNITNLREISIPVPSLSEQQSIVAYLDSSFAKIDEMKANAAKALSEAKALFQAELKKCMEKKEGWEEKNIEDIVDDGSCISYGIVQPGDGVVVGIPVVRPVDLGDKIIKETSNLKKTTNEIADSYKRTILNGKEVLMCVRGTTGVVSMSSCALLGCNVTRGIVPFKIENDTTRSFVYYFILAPLASEYIQKNTKGVALKQINIAEVKKIPVLLPSLEQQQRIVTHLDTLSQKVQELERNYNTILAECDALKQAILRETFE